MAIVQVGLDGSWGQREPHVFSYGGVAGLQFQWNQLDPLWQGLLARYQSTEFHMVDAVNFRGEFIAKSAAWAEHRLQKQDEVICAFIDAIKECGLEIVVCSAEQGLLSQDGFTAKKRDVFEHVVKQLHTTMTAGAVPHSLNFVCDREQDLVKPVLGWIDKLTKTDKALADRIVGVCYVRRQPIMQVQAADLIAYLFREEVERDRHRPEERRNAWLERLCGDKVVNQSLKTRSEFLP